MKKIFSIFLFFIIFTVGFASWKTIELENEFKEKTGKVSAVYRLNRGFIRVDRDDEGEYDFYIMPGDYIGLASFFLSFCINYQFYPAKSRDIPI